MSNFGELAARIDAEPGDEFDTARLSAALQLPFHLVDSMLQGTVHVDDDVLLRLCVIVAEYERNKERYRSFKKKYGNPPHSRVRRTR